MKYGIHQIWWNTLNFCRGKVVNRKTHHWTVEGEQSTGKIALTCFRLFEKFVDWRQSAAVMQREASLEWWRSRHYYVIPTTTTWHNSHRLPLHKSDALPPVHELFKRPSYDIQLQLQNCCAPRRNIYCYNSSIFVRNRDTRKRPNKGGVSL
jgi:hypothetical protein